METKTPAIDWLIAFLIIALLIWVVLSTASCAAMSKGDSASPDTTQEGLVNVSVQNGFNWLMVLGGAAFGAWVCLAIYKVISTWRRSPSGRFLP